MRCKQNSMLCVGAGGNQSTARMSQASVFPGRWRRCLPPTRIPAKGGGAALTAGGTKGGGTVKLSTKGRYAVMAMADLAHHSNGEPVALADVADRQERSLSYLEQLFGRLRRNGLVSSVRGPGGGYMLGREPEQMRIADIII